MELIFPANSGNGDSPVTIKRKTPSELRGDQLKPKRTKDLEDESLVPNLDSVRYTDAHVDDLFSSSKNSIFRKVPYEVKTVTKNVTADHTDSVENSSASIKFAGQQQSAGLKDSYTSIKKCSGSTFRSVTELSSKGEKLTSFAIDMDEALKGLAPAKSSDENVDPELKFCSDFRVPGPNIPLDFTLKTSIRVSTSYSVNWFHRLMNCGTLDGICQLNPKTKQNSSTTTLYSWVHPQCSLPTSVITALTSSMKGEGKMDLLNQRQLAWETAFRSLYVMLRRNILNIFYVCTEQFVAMFTSGNGSIERTGVCNAFLSQSTRTLRLLLKEQDVCFIMPLRNSNVDQEAAEDILELTEMERYYLGMSNVSTVDNSPESLLAFNGNNNVHGLYDFLLNYRFLLTSLTSYDVPLLYSPLPFQNAALSAPEIKCKGVGRIENLPVPLNESSSTIEPNQGSNSIYNSIEIKDAYLTPWVIRSLCDALESNGGDFESSFVTEPMSIGLNVALDTVCQRSENEAAVSDENSIGNHALFGIKNTILSPQLTRAFITCLKYHDRSYTASLSPV
ncbi:uncharacterized protein [Rutidosis leptorrhynchoides]|uniref:uncharacterized protein n=1 Tax=Rutidosis leptorrhynchoides TaxID=125765 RepID=UPI003A99998A